MPAETICPRCRELMPPGEGDCPYCAGRKRVALLRREPVIVVGVIVVIVALWVLTTFVTRAYAARQQQLAQRWFQRGDADLSAGRAPTAVEELQTALAYSRDNFQYRLRLAEALAADGRTRQGQAYLLALWEEEPGNGKVNLELARLAAQANDVSGALRYYHGAIFGIWEDEPVRRRVEARIELVEFLLAHQQRQPAQAELIALAPDMPREPALMLRVAGLMMRADDYRRALQQYREVLVQQPGDADALAGAGKAEFALQMYSEARDDLRRAARADTRDPEVAQRLQIAEMILDADPYQFRLPAAERERRIVRAFAQAGKRLQECAAARGIPLDQAAGNNPAAADYANWTAMKTAVNLRNLHRNPEQGDAAMDLVFRTERDSAQFCGPGSAADQALLLIAQRREGGAP